MDLPLSALTVDPLFQNTKNRFKVEGLKNFMLKRFDPSQLCITVRPADLSKFDAKNPNDSQYYVISGVHTVLALQRMSATELKSLGGLQESAFVPVSIINTADTDLLLYGNSRSNFVSSQFVRKPMPQDLLKIYAKVPTGQGEKLIERMVI